MADVGAFDRDIYSKRSLEGYDTSIGAGDDGDDQEEDYGDAGTNKRQLTNAQGFSIPVFAEEEKVLYYNYFEFLNIVVLC